MYLSDLLLVRTMSSQISWIFLLALVVHPHLHRLLVLLFCDDNHMITWACRWARAKSYDVVIVPQQSVLEPSPRHL
ncbi:hypothetical protein EDB19DRAFT_1750238 [Suillus lakei]|nr:hypothetical protein EDB19DRAFT_1750238 [Suillus lakei]